MRCSLYQLGSCGIGEAQSTLADRCTPLQISSPWRVTCCKIFWQLKNWIQWCLNLPSGMHGRGSQASAPASDAAGRGDAGRTPQTARPCRVVPRGESRIGPTRADAAKIGADAAEIGADAAQIGPTRSVSADIGRYRPVSANIGRYRPKRPDLGRNSKKKKRCKMHRLT